LEDMEDVSEEPFNIIIALSKVRGLLTSEEIAAILRKSKFSIYRMAQTKRITAFMVGGSWRSDPSTITQWLIKKEPQLAAAARKQQRAA